MTHHQLMHFGWYIFWALVPFLTYRFAIYQRKKWIERYGIIFYEDIKDVLLFRSIVQGVMTDTFYYERLEVSVYSQGIYIRFPYHNFPIWTLQIDHIQKVRRRTGEVIIHSNRPITASGETILYCDDEKLLDTFFKEIEFIIHRYKKNHQQPIQLIKKRFHE